MAHIEKIIQVNASAAAAWEKVGDTAGVNNLVSLITACHQEGDTRYCTMADGSKITEKIVSHDSADKRFAYAVTEGPMPIEFHASSMQVFENGNGARIVWSVDVKPDSLVPMFEPMMDMAADSIREVLS